MNKNEFLQLMDEFDDMNAMLEVCRGYTFAETQDMAALDKVLHKLHMGYENIYNKIVNNMEA